MERTSTLPNFATGNIWEFQFLDSPYYTYGETGLKGLMYQYATVNTNQTPMLQAYTLSSTYTQVGSDTIAPSNPVWLRITRSDNTFTFYYSTDGSSWTQDEQTTNSSIPNKLYTLFTIRCCGSSSFPNTSVKLSNFSLSSNIGNGGYAKEGTWTSPNLSSSFNAYKIGNILVTCANASARAYIDKIEILNSGSVVETFNTDITSCSTTSFSASTTVTGGNRQIRITLKGDSSASPSITGVTVNFASETTTTTTNQTTGFVGKPVTVCISISKTVNQVCIDTLSQHKVRINSDSIFYNDLESINFAQPTGLVYKYFEIDKVGIDNVIISQVVINFSVEKQWLTENDVNKDKISLQKYVGESITGALLHVVNNIFRITGLAPLQIEPWLELDATIISETDDKINYESSMQDFSTFAITGEPQISITPPFEQPVQFDYRRIIVTIVVLLLIIFLFKKFNVRRK